MKANLNQLQDIFRKMSEDGFDIKKPLKWSFYFIDDDKNRLEQLYRELEDHQYLIEKFERTESNDWTLQVSKIDTLTVEKLNKRNIAFNELATYSNIKLYDGWDVEKGRISK